VEDDSIEFGYFKNFLRDPHLHALEASGWYRRDSHQWPSMVFWDSKNGNIIFMIEEV
jgi:hypothetical protein